MARRLRSVSKVRTFLMICPFVLSSDCIIDTGIHSKDITMSTKTADGGVDTKSDGCLEVDSVRRDEACEVLRVSLIYFCLDELDWRLC